MKFLSKAMMCCLIFTLMSAANEAEKTRIYVSNFENVLGTSLEIKVLAVSQKDADLAEDAAMNEIDRLSAILSGYDPHSEFSTFLRSSSVPRVISPELFEVLQFFDRWNKRTHGAINASAEVIGQVWKNAEVEQKLPSEPELEQAVDRVKKTHYILSENDRTAIHVDAAPLLLNSFTKSYIIGKAADAAAKTAHVTAVVVNIGGDIVVRGNLKEGIQIADPKASAENDAPIAKISVANMAVATSGNYRRGFKIKNKWYSHIIDPRSGIPADQVISATVVAPNASDAGALATAFNVMHPEESLKLLAEIPDAAALIITRDGKRIASPGWEKLEVAVKKPAGSQFFKASAADKVWNTKYELAINIEIAKIEGARVHSPFVAVWVEDEDKNTIRNLAVWYSKPKWLNDLRSWHRGNAAYPADPEKMSSIGSATRSAGKYTLKWDGKDDHGALVKSGKYTVYIEAAREHGTHQLMSSEMNFNGSAQLINLTGNVEIAAASLDYRKKSSN